MNKKRLISFALSAACALSVMSGCSKSPDNTTPDGNGATEAVSHLPDKLPENTNKYTAAPVKESELQRLEKIYYNEKSEDYKMVAALQGHITALRPLGSDIALHTDSKIYKVVEYSSESEFLFDIPENAVDSIAFLKKTGDDSMVMHFYDNNTMSVHVKGREVKDFPFNRETDSIIEVDSKGEISVLSKREDGYYLCELSEFEKNPEGVKMDRAYIRSDSSNRTPELRDFYTTSSSRYGQQVYFVDTHDNLYHVPDCDGIILPLDSEIFCENTDVVFADDTVSESCRAPVYSKLDDPYSIYTVTNTSDKKEIAIQLPDDYSTKDIKEVYGTYRKLCIQFKNNDFYISEELNGSSTSYKMGKAVEVSKLLAKGNIKDVAVFGVEEAFITMLMEDGTVSFIEAI